MEIKHGSLRTSGHKPPWSKKENVAEAMKMNIEFTHELAQAHPKAVTSVKRKNSGYCPGKETKNLFANMRRLLHSESLLKFSSGDNNSIRNVPAHDEEQ